MFVPGFFKLGLGVRNRAFMFVMVLSRRHVGGLMKKRPQGSGWYGQRF